MESFDVEHSQYVGRIVGLSDPWEQIDRYFIGQTVHCTVRKITEYYVTCELQEGLEGSIYVDELSWASIQENEKLIRSQTVGKVIEASILNIDKDRHNISLSVKRLAKSDCEKFFLAFKGKVIQASVNSVQPSRVYVDFKNGSGRGFLPRRETFFSGDLTRSMRLGDTLDVLLLEYDYPSDTILVSAKRVLCDEFEKAAATLKLGEIVLGEIVNVAQDRVNVIIHQDPYKLHGYIHKSEVSSLFFCDVRLLQRLFKPGEFFQCTVRRIDEFNQVIELTRKGFFRVSQGKLQYGHPYQVFLFKDRSRWIGYSEQFEGVLIDKTPPRGISDGICEVIIASIRDVVELKINGV